MKETDYLYSNILLLEERGVGAFKYKDAVDSIFHYAEMKISLMYDEYRKTKKGMNWFLISNELTKEIDFIKTLNIRIIPRLVDKGEENMGGDITYDSNAKIVDDKLDKATIRINVYVYESTGQIYERSFYNALYHELNHAYQLYCVLLKNPGQIAIDAQPFSVEAKKCISKEALEQKVFMNDIDDTRAKYFSYLFYFAFNKNEANAMLAGLYGDLKGLYKHNDNIMDILKETNLYQTYHSLVKDMDEMFDSLTPEKFNALMEVLKEWGVTHIWKNRNSFKKTMRMWLDNMYNKMGRIASLYMDNVEDINDIDNSIMNDQPGSWDYQNEIMHKNIE